MREHLDARDAAPCSELAALVLCSLPMHGQTARYRSDRRHRDRPQWSAGGACGNRCQAARAPEKSAISLRMPRGISRSNSCLRRTMT